MLPWLSSYSRCSFEDSSRSLQFSLLGKCNSVISQATEVAHPILLTTYVPHTLHISRLHRYYSHVAECLIAYRISVGFALVCIRQLLRAHCMITYTRFSTLIAPGRLRVANCLDGSNQEPFKTSTPRKTSSPRLWRNLMLTGCVARFARLLYFGKRSFYLSGRSP